MWKMQKEKREMRAEMVQMEEERLREYNKKCEMMNMTMTLGNRESVTVTTLP